MIPPEIIEFEQTVIAKKVVLNAEYKTTIKLVNSRNDLEFVLLQTKEQIELAAEQIEETDPEQAMRIRSIFGDPR